MIRPFTLITMVLAALSGAYLFAVKHRAQVLDDRIAQIADQSRQDAERIRVLKAQWSLETDPTRLQQLATQFTSLQQMKPAQLMTFAALQAALPPPGSPPPDGAAPAVPMIAAATPASGTALPLPPAPAPPAMLAAAAPARPIPPIPPIPPRASVAAKAASLASVESLVHGLRDDQPSALHLASARSVAALPPPRPLYTASPRSVYAAPPRPIYAAPPRPIYAAPPRPLYLARASQSALPMGAEVMKVNAAAPDQNGGSMLGMAAELPPPQPAAQNGAVN